MQRDLICELCPNPVRSRHGNANRYCSRQCAGRANKKAHDTVEGSDQAYHLSILEPDILYHDALTQFGVVFDSVPVHDDPASHRPMTSN